MIRIKADLSLVEDHSGYACRGRGTPTCECCNVHGGEHNCNVQKKHKPKFCVSPPEKKNTSLKKNI